MNVRDFDGVDDFLTLGPGDTPIAVGTIAILLRPMSDGNKMVFNDGAGTNQTSVFQLADGTFRVNYGAGFRDSPWVQTAANGWCLLVARKATGSAVVRFSLYDFSSTTWQHGDSGAALADAGTTTVGYTFGQYSGGGNAADIRVLAGAVAAGNIFGSDAAVEDLADNLQAWVAAGFSSLWGFDQASVATDVVDLASNNADEISIGGTAVVDDTDITFNMSLGGAGRPYYAYAQQ